MVTIYTELTDHWDGLEVLSSYCNQAWYFHQLPPSFFPFFCKLGSCCFRESCTLANHTKWLLVCCYRPPDSNEMSDFRSLANNLFPGYDKIIIVGDFNLPNISWADSTYTSVGSLSQNFCDVLDDYFMSQLSLVLTRESNILDLVITNQPELVTLTEIYSPTDFGMSSDHNIIEFHFSCGCNAIHPNKRMIYDYRRANFDDLCKRLTEMDLVSLLTNNGTDCSIDIDWSTWKSAVMSAINEFILAKCV